MKHSKLILIAATAIVGFCTCNLEEAKESATGTSQQPSGSEAQGEATGSHSANKNRNVATTSMPQAVRKAIGGLEFPRLSTAEGNYVIVHKDGKSTTFSTEWDDTKKSLRWSCYAFNTKNSEQNVSRYKPATGQRQYPWDEDLKSLYGVTDFTADPYTNNGRYDHGHICPSADRRQTEQQQLQTFYMTNMMPQYSAFNKRGTWYHMESELRKLVPSKSTDTLFVVKGGTIDKSSQVIEYIKNRDTSKTFKKGYLPVPKYFFVAVLRKEKQGKSYKYSAFGYWFPHDSEEYDAKNDKLSRYVVSIKTLEQKTGIDFFCNLPDDIEQQVEGQDVKTIKSEWGFE